MKLFKLPARITRFVTLLTTTLLASCMGNAVIAETSRPNIVFILADDVAWADLGCYGHPWHRTPNIDRLAERGVRFTNAYASAPICSASRASLLTGKTTASLGFEFVTKNKLGYQEIDAPTALVAPPLTLNLSLSERTIAESLAEAGYETAFFGKWHLNQHHQRYLGWSPTHGPKQQGFQVAEEDFGGHPYAWGSNPPLNIEEEGAFYEDSMVQRVCRFIRQPHDRPFFVMASSFYVHTPVRSPLKWLTNHYEETVPSDAKNRVNRIKYASFLETFDHHLGQIIEAVKTSDFSDDTLIVFFSDNGGHPGYTANAPLRGSKWNLYEGGTRVPLIVHWPSQIRAGSERDTPTIAYDLFSTFAHVANGSDERTEGQAIAFGPNAKSAEGTRDLIWHFPYYHPERGYSEAKATIGINDFVISKTKPHSAIRRGDHKLIWFAEEDRVELYDLSRDLSEKIDISELKPEKATEMKNALHNYLNDHHARMATPR